MSDSLPDSASEAAEAKAHWEARYGERQRIWSGRVNHWLMEFAAPLEPGRALDLGCGEGADAMWLAERGWQVVAVDIAETALRRAAADAAGRGLDERIDFVRQDLSETFPAGEFDLVSAQFLHSMVHLDRPRILVHAAAAVRPGGLLLIVDHGEAPPWAKNFHQHHHELPSAEEVLSAMALDPADWDRVRVGSARREGIGPDGQRAMLVDNVIALRRLPTE